MPVSVSSASPAFMASIIRLSSTWPRASEAGVAAGAASAAAAGAGMVMSSSFTSPNADSGLTNWSGLPTTRMVSLSGCR